PAEGPRVLSLRRWRPSERLPEAQAVAEHVLLVDARVGRYAGVEAHDHRAAPDDAHPAAVGEAQERAPVQTVVAGELGPHAARVGEHRRAERKTLLTHHEAIERGTQLGGHQQLDASELT